MEEVLEFATARRAEARQDLTSFLIQFEFDGKRLDDAQLLNILWNLIAGGVDTTTSQTALTLLHLGAHPELRQQLIDHPELYRSATDEFLRYFSVNRTLSRTVTRDVELGGQHLRKNDRVIISWLAANHDEREFHRRRRGHSGSRTQPPRGLRARAASLHRLASGAGDVRGHGQGGARPHSRLRGGPQRRPPIHGQPGHDRAGHATGHLLPRRKSQNATSMVTAG